MAYNAEYRTTADLMGHAYQPGVPYQQPSYYQQPPPQTGVMGSATMMYRATVSAYQLDFSVQDMGRRIASSKRKITWRFGFPNNEAIERGLVGEACRGEEHEVALVWSVQSGKRYIFHNGVELHYAQGRANKVDHSWNMVTHRGSGEPRVLKLVAYDFPETNRHGPQYELYINGQAFSTFAKLHEVGQVIAGMRGAPVGASLMPLGVYQPGLQQYPPQEQNGYYNSGPRPSKDTNEDLDYAMNASLGDALQKQYRQGY